MNLPIRLTILIATCLSVTLNAQTPQTDGMCEPRELKIALEGPASTSLANLNLEDRKAASEKLLAELLAKYPHDFSLMEYQLDVDLSFFDWGSPEWLLKRQEISARWVQYAKEHPDDSLALLFSGIALRDKNTPEEIRIFEALEKTTPDFPWPSHELAMLYSRSGMKFANPEKMKLAQEKFYALCPSWTDPQYDFVQEMNLKTDLPLAANTAVALRKRLETETDPTLLKDYQILWQREFMSHSPAEHDAIRTQIKKDLKRLESLVPADDDKWQSILINGYELSGATEDELARMNHAFADKFPHGSVAEKLARERFKKEHPLPDDPKDVVAWKTYEAALIDFTRQLSLDFPDDHIRKIVDYLRVVMDDEYIGKDEALTAIDNYVQTKKEYGGSTFYYQPNDFAYFLLGHGWEPARSIEYLKQSETWKQNGHAKRTLESDMLSDDDNARFDHFQSKLDLDIVTLILKAAILLNKPDELHPFRAAIEEPAANYKDHQEQYWANRARLAILDKHPQDALAYYRLALDNRTTEPEHHQGVLRDDVTPEFHALWTAQGGTETAWGLWNEPEPDVPTINTAVAAAPEQNKSEAKPATPAKAKSKPSALKKPTTTEWQVMDKQLPAFELSDFNGKLRRQKDLQGKVVVITTWATWCGWCILQDHNLQKLYDRPKTAKTSSFSP